MSKLPEFLLLRPEAKCQRSVEAMKSAGLNVVGLPLITTEPADEQLQALSSCMNTLESPVILILTSTEAVRYAESLLADRDWNQDVVLAVGQSTAKALQDLGIDATHPEPQTSEGLLALPELSQLEGKPVLLLKGEGGRQLLAETLEQRGAELTSFDLYRRKPNPEAEPSDKWQKDQIRCIIATSGELIDAAFERFDASWLARLHWIVVSERLANQLQQRGVNSVTVSDNATDDALTGAATAYLESEFMAEEHTSTPETQPEQTQPVAEPFHREEPTTKSSSLGGWLLGILNIVLLGALGAAAFFGWQFWQQWQDEKAQLLSQVEKQVTRQQQQQGRLVNQQVEQLKQRLDNQGQDWQQQAGEVEEQLEQLKSSVQTHDRYLEEVVGRRPNDWILAEADYLVNIAGRKLWLEHDVKTAVTMLAAADQRLAQLDDASLIPIREKLAEDIQQLQQLNNQSLTEVALKLGALVKSVQDLPLDQVVLPDPVDTSVQAEVTSSISDWRDNLAKSWHAFVDDFITVRRRTEQVKPLLDNQQQWLVREQLRLVLLKAQQAALQEQQALYHQALADGRQLVEENFAMQAPAVDGFLTQLIELQQVSLERRYPESLKADKPLTELLEQRVKRVFKGLES
ncbi:Uroporphyrinogen-III synthase [Saliniradius amylolyticus]|uniref:Uroporphyrinogen-III synthase n=1 Tax=Saliniradius amylolyticus TaxID=2183582 RepID=A0A2S2E6R8_9ALTE|nr:uroporphyrinogen-III C-methyltransferase [Saliniradius amylolyticus]AWL13341.1 Uroporphyrinogen-III synthase [Saliniradius amylolyticus]